MANELIYAVVEAEGARSTASCAADNDPPLDDPPLTLMPLETTGADGVIEFEAELADPVPLELVAVTVKVYAVPFVRPVTVMGDEAPLAVMPLGLEVTV